MLKTVRHSTTSITHLCSTNTEHTTRPFHSRTPTQPTKSTHTQIRPTPPFRSYSKTPSPPSEPAALYRQTTTTTASDLNSSSSFLFFLFPFPFLLFTMTDSIVRKPSHSRHDTALIHGLSTSDVQALSTACIEAKERAYCKFGLYFFTNWCFDLYILSKE